MSCLWSSQSPLRPTKKNYNSPLPNEGKKWVQRLTSGRWPCWAGPKSLSLYLERFSPQLGTDAWNRAGKPCRKEVT